AGYFASSVSSNINGNDGELSISIPPGYYSGQICTASDTNLTGPNIAKDAVIFGVTGSYIGVFANLFASGAHRNPSALPVPHLDPHSVSNRISLSEENTTYSDMDLPSSGGYAYREVPAQEFDDEGGIGTSCKYALRPSNICGTTQSTIAARIADCATANPLTNTWDGSTQCKGNEGSWKLVTLSATNKEVWRDETTGLLWSSLVTQAYTDTNWCRASGNTQQAPITYANAYNNTTSTEMVGNGTIGNILGGSSSASETISITFSSSTAFTVSGANCGGGAIISGGLTTSAGSTVTWERTNYCTFTITQGSTPFAANDTFVLQSTDASIISCLPGAASGMQPITPISLCYEPPINDDGAALGETWSTGTYSQEKGLMGKNSSPSVRWRLPTLRDYKLADLNGIRFVLPDIGVPSASRPIKDGSLGFVEEEWTATVFSTGRHVSWAYDGRNGFYDNAQRTFTREARCIGR
ncbi:MAG: hypothetical protein KDD61_12640, partial [Bdellovibrionales bacterium]|nr:hypothetical protein [Bdellovibrionales bacterium]